mgnify:CR=1 FL=1|jgi:hypothetical protein
MNALEASTALAYDFDHGLEHPKASGSPRRPKRFFVPLRFALMGRVAYLRGRQPVSFPVFKLSSPTVFIRWPEVSPWECKP